MGKGDKKSKKGKITMGSFGNSRRRRLTTSKGIPAATAPKGSSTAGPVAPAAAAKVPPAGTAR